MNIEDQAAKVLEPLSQIKLRATDKQAILNHLRQHMASEQRTIEYPRHRRNQWLLRSILSAATVAAALTAFGVITLRDQPKTPGLPAVITKAYAYSIVAPSHFNAVEMTSSVYGWGTGYNKSGRFELIKTVSGGLAWNKVELPVKPPVYDVSLNQIGQPGYVTADFINGQDGYLSWIDPRGRQMTVMHTTDGGGHWLVSHTRVSVYASTVSSMDFVSPKIGWILATSTIATGSEQKFLYRTTDGGKVWVNVAGGTKLPYQGTMTSLSFTDKNHGWFGAGNPFSNTVNLYRTSDGGTTWQRVSVPTPSMFLSQSNAVATTAPIFHGRSGTFVATFEKLEGGADHDYAVIYHSANGGGTWTATTPSVLKDTSTNALYMGVQNGWAVKDGTVYQSIDSGKTWIAVGRVQTNDSKRYPVMSDLTFVSLSTGWLLLQSTDFQHSVLLKTTNGGHTWQTQP